MHFDWTFFQRYLFEPSSIYLHGLWLTLSISVVCQLAGTIIGLFAALGRLSSFRSLQMIVRFYTWVMRGVPLLVWVIFIFTALAAANIYHFTDIDLGFMTLPANIQAGVIALSLNEGAYMAEIIRAAITSIDTGKVEASKSLGMRYHLFMRRIILPQAARFVILPLGNEFNSMLKNTTLLSVIGIPELLLATQMVISATFKAFELYTVVALYYLLLTTLWGFIQRRIELRFSEPHTRLQVSTQSGGWRRLFSAAR